MDAFLDAVVSEPDRGRRRPVAVLSRFESDDPTTRLRAAAAVGAVAEAYPGTAAYFASRLADRHDEDAAAVAAALQYLATAFPEETSEALAGDGEAEGDAVRPVGSVSLELHQTKTSQESGVRVVTDDGEEADEDDSDDTDSEAAETGAEDDTDSAAGLAVARDIAERSAVAGADQITPASGLRHADAYDAIGRLDGGTETVLIKRFEDGGREAFERGVSGWERAADHDNIVGVYDWGFGPDPWSVVEYSTDTLAGHAPLSPRVAVEVTATVARAVAYAHQRDVVHGGIGPRNVVLAPGDGSPVPKLTNVALVPEMGVAVPFDPRHAAPEFYDESLGGIDARTDIYQLGALAYTLLTGMRPVNDDADSVRQRVLGADPTPPSDVVSGLPSALDAVIATATASEKIRRYRSVERFANQLGTVVG